MTRAVPVPVTPKDFAVSHSQSAPSGLAVQKARARSVPPIVRLAGPGPAGCMHVAFNLWCKSRDRVLGWQDSKSCRCCKGEVTFEAYANVQYLTKWPDQGSRDLSPAPCMPTALP